MKPIKDHSAKLKINLQSSTAQDGPPKNASLRPLKIPSYSSKVLRGIPQPLIDINSLEFNDCKCICRKAKLAPTIANRQSLNSATVLKKCLFCFFIATKNKAVKPQKIYAHLCRIHNGHA